MRFLALDDLEKAESAITKIAKKFGGSLRSCVVFL